MNQNFLCALVVLNKKGFEEAGKGVAMQVAAMSPIALNAESVPQDIKDAETKNAVEKAKQNQIAKAVEAALKKAGINPAHVDTEAHIESNMSKGWITAEDAAKAREIIAKESAAAAASLNMNMIENIVNGRIQKIYKEQTLLNQAFIKDQKISVAQYLASASKTLTVTAFKRVTLNEE
jgi:elongation factor Ts